MNAVRGGLIAPELRPTQCTCLWRAGGPACPNEYAVVVETLHAPGFMKACGPHIEGWRRSYSSPDTREWSREEWIRSDRERELCSAILTCHLCGGDISVGGGGTDGHGLGECVEVCDDCAGMPALPDEQLCGSCGGYGFARGSASHLTHAGVAPHEGCYCRDCTDGRRRARGAR
jgi:hypothetical protein